MDEKQESSYFGTRLWLDPYSSGLEIEEMLTYYKMLLA